MASLDNVYDAIRSAIPTYTGFSTKQEIENPYSLEDNPNQFLTDSWGVILESGAKSDKDSIVESYIMTTDRAISVVLSRAVYNMNTDVKNLLLDTKTIRNNFLSQSKFGILRGGEEIVYIGDNGVNFINNEKFKFIYTKIDFTFEIIETIN